MFLIAILFFDRIEQIVLVEARAPILTRLVLEVDHRFKVVLFINDFELAELASLLARLDETALVEIAVKVVHFDEEGKF